VVHDISGRDPWFERDPLPKDLDRKPAMVAGGICLGVALLAVTRLLDDFVFAVAAVMAMKGLRHLAATRLRVLAGWALTLWCFWLLFVAALWIVVLLIAALGWAL
jgi:hypothetical protein